MNNNQKPKLEDLKKNIKKEIPFVDVKPFSHNIISMTLSMIEENYGEAAAVQTMSELRLDKLGWDIVTED